LWFKIIDVDICNEKHDDISGKLESVDIIFIAGGNVFYLLQEMKKNWVDGLIKTLVENWKIYIWSSAWSVVVWPDIGIVRSLDNPQDATDLSSYGWIGLVDYSIIPHCDNIKFKEKIEKIFKDNVNYKYPIIKLNDNQAIFIEWNKICFLEDSI
jgi:dipeptidase E